MLRDAIAAHESHAQALILLFARLADIVSTRLASRRLVLEANPVVRSLGWRFAWATLAVCGIAYLPERGPSLALSASVLSLFVAASNLSRGWAMRAIGEEAYRAHMRRVLAAAKPAQVYLTIAAASAMVGSAGALLLVLEPDPDGAAWSFAMGILLYAGATWFHSSVAVRRMLREAAHATSHP